jgi:predicted lipoprotein with Yx(FWY)xxD motif
MIRKGTSMNTRMRIKLGLVALTAVAAAGCSLVPPQAAPVTVPAPAAQAPAPATDSGQAAQAPGTSSSGDSSQASAALGQRSAEGGYWPLSVQLGQNADLGPVLVDGQGFTLYRFDKDQARPSQSNCSGTCAAQWPPVLANNTITFKNLDASVLGTVQRKDGTQQVTVGGWPVYRYINDVVPGQATGEGVGGTWFAAAPDGSKASRSSH